MAKAIIIDCYIGKVSISNTAIESLTVNRNFTDVSDKFSMTLIDSPVSNDKATDLELYMAGGGRAINFRYGDDPAKLLYFKGTIWDYKNTFVGDIKKLEISGYVTKADYIQNESGTTWSYNIDWNNYFNLRADAEHPWNVLEQLRRDSTLSTAYANYLKNINTSSGGSYYDPNTKTFNVNYTSISASVANPVQMSSVLDSVFHEMFTYNTTYIRVKGPVGSIDLPVPDSFVTSNDTAIVSKDGDSGITTDFVKQACKLYWDDSNPTYWKWDYFHNKWVVVPVGSDGSPVIEGDEPVYVRVNYPYLISNKPIVGFIYGGTCYVQVNLKKAYAGAGIQIKNTFGVSPSDIVRKLAILEGWKIGNIVDTELVSGGDNLKMKDQSALDFIYNNLVPLSIMPSGVVTRKDGETQIVASGTGGYVPYFKNGKFYYEPLNTSHLIDKRIKDARNIYLGYNIPNSPVLSFQVDTKGTSFYVTQPVKISAMTITTGIEDAQVSTTSTAAIDQYNKVAGHNEGLDSFLGYSYDEVQNNEQKAAETVKVISDLWNANSKVLDSSVDTRIEGKGDPYLSTDNSEFRDIDFYNPQTILNSKLFSKNLSSTLAVSAVSDSAEIRSRLTEAKEKIRTFMVKATLTMWGDTAIAPANLITITNMVKSENKNYPDKHPTSGDYLITSQTDQLSSSGFIQTLNMFRYTTSMESSLNQTKVDWSKGIKTYKYDIKTESKNAVYGNNKSGPDLVGNNYKTPPVGYIKIGTWEGHDVYAKGDGIYFYIIDIGPVNKNYTAGFFTWLQDMLTQGGDASYVFIGNGLYYKAATTTGGTVWYYQILDPRPVAKQSRAYYTRVNSLAVNPTIRLILDDGSYTDLYSTPVARKPGVPIDSRKLTDYDPVYLKDGTTCLKFSHYEDY